MNEKEFVKQMLKNRREAEKADEEFRMQKIPVRIKLILEGFRSDQSDFIISPDIRITRAPIK